MHSLYSECQVYLPDQCIFSQSNRYTNLKPGNLVGQFSEEHQTKWKIRLPCVKYKMAEKTVLCEHIEKDCCKCIP